MSQKPCCSAPSPFTQPREEMWKLQLHNVARNLEKMNFSTSVVDTVADAGKLVMEELVPAIAPQSVSFGGSMTVLEAGLLDAFLQQKHLNVLNTFDHTLAPEAMIELRRQSLLVDLFLCSVNAITQDGTLMLLDGIGNRTAAIQFGPRKVILLVGRNKLCADINAGFERVKTTAAPANAVRLKRKTPCAKVGKCMNCDSPDRICSAWSLITRSNPKGRIHVILINQETGF